MAQPREPHTGGCGTVINPSTGLKEFVVISGVGSDEVSTEIYNIDNDAWRYGPNYPLGEVEDAVVVQDALGSFYVIGGFQDEDDTFLDMIYRFDEDTYEFVEVDQRLPYNASAMMGLMVEREIIGV